MAKRRKYEFPSREAAEAEVHKVKAESLHRVRCMMALYKKKIRWLDRRGEYKVGLFDEDSPVGPRVLFVFEPRELKQSPSMVVGDAYEWASETRQHYTRAAIENDEARGIVELADLVMAEVNKPMRKPTDVEQPATA